MSPWIPLRRDWQGINNQAYIGSATLRDELQLSQQPLEPRMKKSIAWESGKTHYSMRMSEDEDISHRRWILIDIDAGQPAGTNSSETRTSWYSWHGDGDSRLFDIARLSEDSFDKLRQRPSRLRSYRSS